MKELIEQIAKALVDNPDQVSVRPIEGEQTTVLELSVAQSDLGKVIGKQGWFYTFQLKGCSVFAVNGEYIGTITDVLDLGGPEILKVDRENEETLIPFAHTYLKRIDWTRGESKWICRKA